MRNTGFTKVYRSAKYPYFLLSFFSSTNTNYIFFPVVQQSLAIVFAGFFIIERIRLMKNDFNRKIVLEDGSEYFGYGFGYHTDRVCEIVFNTSMIGYQEIVTDPSYTYQMVVMTYPLIGNYGITDEDFETRIPTIGGLVVRELSLYTSPSPRDSH